MGSTATTELPHGWICDKCWEPIEDPQQGSVIWKSVSVPGSPDEDAVVRYWNFRLVHKGCDPLDDNFPVSMDLDWMIGQAGMARMLGWLTPGPLKPHMGQQIVVDLAEFVNLFRRLQVPGYEQARRYFGTESVREEFGGANEYDPYLPDSLKRIRRLGAEEERLNH